MHKSCRVAEIETTQNNFKLDITTILAVSNLFKLTQFR